jgi:N-acetylmuramoyl-L-alanine amidase
MLLGLAAAIRAAGVPTVEISGWKTRGRLTGSDGAKHGAMFHHTASPLSMSTKTTVSILVNGRSDLPGPLCNVAVGRDRRAYIVAAGKANHAGYGGPWRDVPKDSGNLYICGVEVENNGIGEPYDFAVLDRVFGAILGLQGRAAGWCVGHKEWAPARKNDPYPVDMAWYRRRLAGFMATGGEGGDEVAFVDFTRGYRERWNECVTGKKKDGSPASPPGSSLGSTVPDPAKDPADLAYRVGRKQADVDYLTGKGSLPVP